MVGGRGGSTRLPFVFSRSPLSHVGTSVGCFERRMIEDDLRHICMAIKSHIVKGGQAVLGRGGEEKGKQVEVEGEGIFERPGRRKERQMVQ